MELMEMGAKGGARGPKKQYTRALTIYLTEEDLAAAHELAEARGASVAALVRGWLREEVARVRRQRKREGGE